MPIKFPFSRRAAPSDAWTKCPSCEAQVFNRQLEPALQVGHLLLDVWINRRGRTLL